MLSIRRLMILAGMVCVIATLFISYTYKSSVLKTFGFTLEQPKYEMLADVPVKEGNPVRFVFPISEDPEPAAVNLIRYLEDTHQEVTVLQEKVDFDQMNTKRDVVIFTEDTLSSVCGLQDFEEYVQTGGHCILAAGVPEGSQDSYIWPLLGIREKGGYVNPVQFRVTNGILPINVDKLEFHDYTVSSFFNLSAQGTVYLEEDDTELPLIYSIQSGDGQIGVFNTSLLEYAENAGWFMALFNQMKEMNIYPVMGSRTLVLNNYPLNMILTDELSAELYGKGTEAFVREDFLPALQSLSARNSLPYTCSVNILARKNSGFPQDNRNLFSSTIYDTLRINAELAFASGFYGESSQLGDELVLNESFIEMASEILPDYEMQTLIQAGLPQKAEEVRAMEALNLKVHGATPSHLTDETKESSHSDEPETEVETASVRIQCQGTDLRQNRLFQLAGQLVGSGSLSLAMDCQAMITDGTEDNWKETQKELNALDRKLLQKTDWLQSSTISQLQPAAQSLNDLKYSWKQSDDQISLKISSAMCNQAFLLFSRQSITDSEGAEVTQLENGYWMIRITDTDVVLHLESNEKGKEISA